MTTPMSKEEWRTFCSLTLHGPPPKEALARIYATIDYLDNELNDLIDAYNKEIEIRREVDRVLCNGIPGAGLGNFPRQTAQFAVESYKEKCADAASISEERDALRDMLTRIANTVDDRFNEKAEECVADGVDSLVDEVDTLSAERVELVRLIGVLVDSKVRGSQISKEDLAEIEKLLLGGGLDLVRVARFLSTSDADSRR